MKTLTKERMQQIWDCELINAWCEKGKTRIGVVTRRFLIKINSPIIIDHKLYGDSFDANLCEDYMISLDLDRCLDYKYINKIKVKCFVSLKSDVIGFIHARCEKMSLDLINGELKPIVLININNYKWKSIDVGRSKKYRQMQRRKKIQSNQIIKIKSRELDKNHDWNIVK